MSYTSDIDEMIESKDFLGLKDVGIWKGFGVADDNGVSHSRLQCYSILLGCGQLMLPSDSSPPPLSRPSSGSSTPSLSASSSIDDETELCQEMKECPLSLDHASNSFSKIISTDIKRNGYSRWDKTANLDESQRSFDLEQIEKLLNSVFAEYQELNYIQSFDSIFALFYMISNGNLCIAKKMVVSYLHIFKSDLSLKSDSFGHLDSIWSYLENYDHSYYKWLMKIMGSNKDVSFALEWYISWFSHTSIQDFDTILRIYDFMISTQNQCIGLYMVLAMLLVNKKYIMENTKTLSDFICVTRNKLQFDAKTVNKVMSKCYFIMQSEMKKTQRRNEWKRNKMEAQKTWRKFKRSTMSLLS